MARPSLVKAKTSDCNLSWDRQIKQEAAHLSKMDREDTRYDQINVFLGKKTQTKSKHLPPSPKTTKKTLQKQLIPLPTPHKKTPTSMFY